MIGDEKFKGAYQYNITLIKKKVNQSCVYHSTGQVDRKCVGNLATGPYWEKTEMGQCTAKYKATNELIDLAKVTF